MTTEIKKTRQKEEIRSKKTQGQTSAEEGCV